MYGIIDSMEWWGDEVTAAWVVEALQGAGDGPVLIHMNCPGGDVFEALAIYASIRSHPGDVTVRVEGLAASAASYIMLAADRVEVEPNAMVMIHDAWSVCVGDSADMRASADMLDKTSANIASIYAGRAGGTVEQWRTAMLTETWYVGQEVVDAGLADTVNGTEPVPDDVAGVSDRFNLGVYQHAPTVNALGGRTPPTVPATQPGDTQPAPVPAGAAKKDPIVIDVAGLKAALMEGLSA